MKALIYVLLMAVGCACTSTPTPAEIARRLAEELTPEQRECVAKESALAALKASACGKNNEGECNNDAIYARSLERKYRCLEK